MNAAAAPAEAPPAFVALEGVPPGSLHPLAPGDNLLGRAPECRVRIEHPEISRLHASVSSEGGRWRLRDLGSRRGTSLNGTPIQAPADLRDGDAIGLGPVAVRFRHGVPPGLAGDDASTGTPRENALREIPLRGEITLGRDAACEVVLADPAVSRRHCSVRPVASGWEAADLAGTAGTFVNGRRFDRHDLVIGDRLQIGPHHFRFTGTSLLPVRGVAGAPISARHLGFSLGDRTLLAGVELEVEPGAFAAIIGPSGAGKSTLLGLLAGLREPTEGEARIAGQPPGSAAATLGYVPQDDIVHGELPVVAALRFAAELRLPPGTPDRELHKLVVQTLRSLGLAESAATPVRRLSGGQRKRVSVGAELLARPDVLFLDEPTSGLDPATEFQIMELLRSLASGGCTIVCTTHVVENLYLVDRLHVVDAGRLVFSGTAAEARAHYGVTRLPAIYERLGAPSQRAVAPPRPRSRRVPPAAAPRRRGTLPILLRRMLAITAADRRDALLLAAQPALVGGLLAWVSEDPALILFFAQLAALWFGCSNGAQEIVRELPIYRRERLIGVGRHAYLASKFLFLGAITLLQTVVLAGILLVAERGLDGHLLLQAAGLAGAALAGVAIGCALSALARSVMQAVVAVPLALIPLILFSGHPIPAHEMSPSVTRVAAGTPTYAARTLTDASFLWGKPLARDLLSDRWTSFRNLNRDRSLKTGEIFRKTGPVVGAVGTLVAWGVGGYGAAWFALRRREREA
jgi:ABC-type multidrug transport system ATPase subunit